MKLGGLRYCILGLSLLILFCADENAPRATFKTDHFDFLILREALEKNDLRQEASFDHFEFRYINLLDQTVTYGLFTDAAQCKPTPLPGPGNATAAGMVTSYQKSRSGQYSLQWAVGSARRCQTVTLSTPNRYVLRHREMEGLEIEVVE